MEEISLEDFDELCNEVFEKRKLIDGVKEELSGLNKELELLNSQVMAYLSQLGRDKHHSSMGTLSVDKRLSVKVPKDPENRALFFDYLRNRGVFDDLITVNAQTINAFYKQELDIANENQNVDFEIPGIETPTYYERLKLRRNK